MAPAQREGKGGKRGRGRRRGEEEEGPAAGGRPWWPAAAAAGWGVERGEGENLG